MVRKTDGSAGSSDVGPGCGLDERAQERRDDDAAAWSGGRRGWCRGSRAPRGRRRAARIASWLTTLMPSLRVMTSAGWSRMARATNGSSTALPENPRLTRSSPAARAATIGQAPRADAAPAPWLIDEPWCTQRGAVTGDGADTGASVVSATSRVVSPGGSQISTSRSTVPSPPSTRSTTPGGPGSLDGRPGEGFERDDAGLGRGRRRLRHDLPVDDDVVGLRLPGRRGIDGDPQHGRRRARRGAPRTGTAAGHRTAAPRPSP